MSPLHLTPQQQEQAIAQWGHAGSWRCFACDQERLDQSRPPSVPTRMGVRMAICWECSRRAQISPRFRRNVQRLAEQAAHRSTWQRVADLVGVTGEAMLQAMRETAAVQGKAVGTCIDVRLGLPLGSVTSALAQVLSRGQSH